MRDKNTPLCLHPLLYTPVWSGWWRVAEFSQIPNMNLRLLGGSGALSRFPRVVAPSGAANWEANWEASGQELGHLFSWRDQAVMQSEFKATNISRCQYSTPRWGVLQSSLHFYLKTKQTKKKTTTEEGNEKIKLLFCNAALLAWKVLEQMPCPPLNIHNISL